MGLAYDTGKTFKYVLVTDRDKPEADQPKFLLRYLSARDYTRVAQIFDDAVNLDNVAYVTKVVEGLRLCMTGWEDLKDSAGKQVPFDLNEIDAHLSLADLSELRGNVLDQMQTNELEKKLSAFAAQSTSDSSASPTVAASA